MPQPIRLALIALFIHLDLTYCLAAEPRRLEFNRDIRPILSDHCFACHGPDGNTREADMRLDTEQGLFDSDAPPVIRNDPNASPLVQRITADDVDERMPPPEFGKDLSSEQVELLRQWVAQGADWQGHWAFQPIRRPKPPSDDRSAQDSNTDSAADRTNPVDAFVVEELETHGLALSPPADRRTLARRLHFDLLGLPPTPEVVERFEHSDDPLAYELLVDELLASPHFGERMAMWWLDLVRYADSVGYHGDQPVSVSPFRDYVIASFNSNKPFDRFTIEQLAGDLLPEPTREQQIAAGYNRLGMMSAEGGVQPKEYLAKYIAERVRNLGGTWLGVTLGCCECHDHKYDPFATKDFYQFEAFFADIQERGLYGGNDWGPNMPVPNEEQQAKLTALDADIAAVRDTLNRPTDELARGQVAWEAKQALWVPLAPESMQSAAGATLTRLADDSVLASGPSPVNDTYTLTFDSWPADITALRIDAIPDESLPHSGPGRAGNGNFVLTELELGVLRGDQISPIALQNASATFEQKMGAAGGHPDKKWSAASAIDGDTRGPTWGWAIMGQVGRPNSAVFEIAPDTNGATAGLTATNDEAARSKLQVVLKQQPDSPQHTLGRFRILVTSAARPIDAQQLLPVELREILAIAREARTPEQAEQLATHYRSLAPELSSLREQLKQLEAEREQLNESIPSMLVTKTVEPRMVRVLARGNWMDESGIEVRPAIPALLGGDRFNALCDTAMCDATLPDTAAKAPGATNASESERRLNRLDLAEWVVADENPLTARVAVNRLWKLFFGAGLSGKLDDLGAQGEWPSHPELLDWLADEFRVSGWNVKHIVKLMVMSDAYRQDSFASSAIAASDPYNRLISHQGRWRLDAEVVRDTLLASCGLLEDRVGGESVNPYQPAGYWSYLNFPQREWHNGQGAELYRRGLYTHWQRQYLHPSLLAFDAPSREECTADRPRSNTPLQALVLLNDPTYVEAARALAFDTLEAAEDDPARIVWALRAVLARPPRAQELPILTELLEKHRSQFAADIDSAKQLLSVGDFTVPDDLDAAELAAWTSVARTLLNLHESVTRN
ncbi:MAG: DUF1553 domain-containing protein [Pirellulaceae bacterium]